MRQWPLAQAFVMALLAGLAIAIAIFEYRLGVRANAAESLGTVRFPFKFIVTLSLTLPAVYATYRLSRPNGDLGQLWLALLAAPVLLAADARRSPHHEVLLNLNADVPEGFGRFDRLVEVVSAQDEADRSAARARWKHYASRGYAITRHDLVLKAN